MRKAIIRLDERDEEGFGGIYDVEHQGLKVLIRSLINYEQSSFLKLDKMIGMLH